MGLLPTAHSPTSGMLQATSHGLSRRIRRGQILDFAKDAWDRIDVLLIHCEEGNSRSPAVAAAVSRIYLGDDRTYFLPYMYWPNKYVYKVLLDVARKRGELRHVQRRAVVGVTPRRFSWPAA